MSPKITAIAELAPKAMQALIIEAQDEIEAALVAAITEAQANEAKAKLNLTFKTTINADSNALEYALGWSVAHKLTHSESIPDQNQVELQMEPITE